jgi:polar amino acid transport system substrate-binding protein
MKGLKKNLALGLRMLLVFFCGQVSATKVSILTEHLSPFQIVTTNAIEGLSTEIVEATLAQAQYEYAISAHPWALSYRRAQHGKNTCIYSLARIPQRESLFKWVGHIASSTTSFYSLRNSQIIISTIEEAKKYNIAVIRDDVAHHFLLSKKFIENQNLYVVDNYDSLLKLLDLSSRHIDLVVLNDDLLRNRVNNLGETSKYKNVFQFKTLMLNFHFACSLNTEQVIIDNLINAMKLLEKSGVFLTIRKRWGKNMVSLIN